MRAVAFKPVSICFFAYWEVQLSDRWASDPLWPAPERSASALRRECTSGRFQQWKWSRPSASCGGQVEGRPLARLFTETASSIHARIVTQPDAFTTILWISRKMCCHPLLLLSRLLKCLLMHLCPWPPIWALGLHNWPATQPFANRVRSRRMPVARSLLGSHRDVKRAEVQGWAWRRWSD